MLGSTQHLFLCSNLHLIPSRLMFLVFLFADFSVPSRKMRNWLALESDLVSSSWKAHFHVSHLELVSSSWRAPEVVGVSFSFYRFRMAGEGTSLRLRGDGIKTRLGQGRGGRDAIVIGAARRMRIEREPGKYRR